MAGKRWVYWDEQGAWFPWDLEAEPIPSAKLAENYYREVPEELVAELEAAQQLMEEVQQKITAFKEKV